MADAIERPQTLGVNAWTGESSPRQDLPQRTPWAQIGKLAGQTQWLAAPKAIDERKWTDPDVGWGLVLLDNDDLSPAQKAAGEDAPAPIRLLLHQRSKELCSNAPVLRWRPKLQQNYLRRYYPDGASEDLRVQAPNPGVGKGRVPRYLLIYATPQEIPWAVQYALNMSAFVGRLDLTEDALSRYVDALINDWGGQVCDPRAPVVWSVDHGLSDITRLMAREIAARVWAKIDANADLTKRRWLKEASATRQALGAALAELSPALIVTTSHGMTGPLNDKNLLLSQLGSPVDVERAVLGPRDLDGWRPSGAIWFSQACCAAGSDAESRYKGLLPADGSIGAMLNGIAATAGATTSPLTKFLLGADKPLRAFVGHVEPTFDWTLRDPANKQVLTHVLCEAFYDRLYQDYARNPIGWVLQKIYDEAGHFYASWQSAVQDIDKNVPGMRDQALYRQMVAMDRQTLVILGDPTVSLPSVS
jgi:hypothetical protein